MNKCKHFFITCATSLSLLVVGNARETLAANFQGFTSGSYELFEADIEPVDINFDDGTTVNSGDIRFRLDSDKPSSFVFDFDNMTHTYEVGLLVYIEALDLIDIPEQKITINLTGPITLTEPDPDQIAVGKLFDLTIFANPINGGGTFDPGQLLSGWKYENIQVITINQSPSVKGDNNEVGCEADATADGEGQVGGSLSSQGGRRTRLRGSGRTRSRRRRSPGGLNCTFIVKVPESSSNIATFLTLGILGTLPTLKRSLRN